MLYTLEQGPTEKKVLENCYRYRQPIPEAIANAPELLQGLEFYLIAFFKLNTCRSPGGMGEGPIMWSAVQEYLDRSEIWDIDDREEFTYLIEALDEEYRKYASRASSEKT